MKCITKCETGSGKGDPSDQDPVSRLSKNPVTKKKGGEAVARRQKVKKKTDKKIFRKTAVRTKLINNRTMTPRGGIRL